MQKDNETAKKFLSTLSLRRATVNEITYQRQIDQFLSTLSLRRATAIMLYDASVLIFLSTLSLRRATCIIDIINNVVNDFYPRSPCGERRWNSTERPVESHFYPRSPCGERLYACWTDPNRLLFLSTLSLRRATIGYPVNLQPKTGFLSTLSLRRATSITITITCIASKFLSTLSLRRATTRGQLPTPEPPNFYPRSPCGERHDWPPVRDIIQWISIHALLAESDLYIRLSIA